MRNARVAIACCRRRADGRPADLYPDRDAAPLRAALRELGVASWPLSWDDPGADWGSYSHVLVSSTWDSVDRPAEYLAWARAVSALSTIVNPLTAIEWNLDKLHQRELAASGLPVVATTWVAPGDTWAPCAGPEIVVKPSVSAGGRETARYAGGDGAALAHVRALQERGLTAMVQPYLPAIDEEGETDLIFVDGRYSHAVIKQPMLRVGEGVVAQSWERMAWSGLASPSPEQLAVAGRAVEMISARVQEVPAYCRIDLITGPRGDPVLLEAEMIDPYLSFDLAPAGAASLAAAVLGR